MNQHQHKILSSLIVTTITFLGFESLSVIIGLNQVSAFTTTAIYLFLFHIFWIAFVFDLHLKRLSPASFTSARFGALVRQALLARFEHFFNWKYFRHFINYFILPSILFWATTVLLFLNPFANQLKQALVIISTFAFAVAYWHMKEHASAKFEAHKSWLPVLATIKLFVAYIAFSAVIGFSWYFDLGREMVFYYVLAVSFFLIHQALFSYNYNKPKLVFFTIAASALIAWVGLWVYGNWTYQYFTGGLVLLALYNTIWGFIHHSLDKTFTTKIALEYLILGLLVVSIIFATHNFGTQIL
jgi:hypothetical protein